MAESTSKDGRLTRKSAKESAVFLIGSLSEHHPPGLLPVKLDVLREALWQEQSGGNISCPIQHGNTDLKCEDPDVGCQSASQCSVRKLLLMWREAGIKTVVGKTVKSKIETLVQEYKSLRKSKSKTSDSVEQRRNAFREMLDKDCFNIIAPDAKDLILKDRLRSQAAKDSDLAFIEDQLTGARKMRFTSVDKSYSNRVEKRKIREMTNLSRIEQEKARIASESPSNIEGESIDFDLDFPEELGEADSEDSPVKKQRKVQPRTKKAEDRTIPLAVPVNILEKTSADAARFGLSYDVHAALVAAFINVSGGNVDDFVLSKSSSKRVRDSTGRKFRTKIQEEILSEVSSKSCRLVLHTDGKTLPELSVGKVKKDRHERLAVSVSSPDLSDGSQLLGCPELETGTGLALMEASLALTNDWCLTEHLVAVSYDTTGTNSAPGKGMVGRIERELDRRLIRLPCRHHIIELRGKHASEKVSGRSTTGPGDVLFKKFRANCPRHPEIEMSNLSKFEYSDKNEDITELAESNLKWGKSKLNNNTFARGDYLYLCKLIVIYLGGNVENFHFQKPIGVHSARFMQRAIYYLHMCLIKDQIQIFELEELSEIQTMADYVALFYGKEFLEAPLLADAGLNDLEAWQFMERYREHQPVLAEGVLGNMSGHLDYLSEENIVFSLASRKVRSAEKKEIVDTLLSLEDVDVDLSPPPVPRRGSMKVEIPKPLKTSRETRPSLAEFVGPKSWLVFERLNLIASLDWMLEDDVNRWVEYQSYNNFCDFVMKFNCTNDEAERNIKMLQDNLKDGQTLEDVLQDNLLLVSAHRKLVKADKAGNRTKTNLSQMGKLL